MAVFLNGKHVTLSNCCFLCREPCSVHLKSAIVDLQNVCKAEHVFRLLET